MPDAIYPLLWHRSTKSHNSRTNDSYCPSSKLAVASADHVISRPNPDTVWQPTNMKTTKIKAANRNALLIIFENSIFLLISRPHQQNLKIFVENSKYLDNTIYTCIPAAGYAIIIFGRTGQNCRTNIGLYAI